MPCVISGLGSWDIQGWAFDKIIVISQGRYDSTGRGYKRACKPFVLEAF